MPEEKSASPDRIPAPRLSRRTACKLGIATALLAAGRKVAGVVLPLTAHSSAPATKNQMTTKPHIAIIGAGAFGGWTALYLLRSGAQVTLLDAWGPGNSRASSGGETRVIRGAYGPDQHIQNSPRAHSFFGSNTKPSGSGNSFSPSECSGWSKTMAHSSVAHFPS